ncbi:MAG: holo-ACP synthase [Alphaproteobacteria bacterium]|nr:holo-ACP synthase [Alphaproteobacteria bacterium]
MIIGIGTDLLDCRRLERPLKNHRERFLSKILTDNERFHIESKVQPITAFLDTITVEQHFCLQVGKIFAAKEAFVKALGTGFRDGLTLLDMEIVRNSLGKPSIYLHSKAEERFNAHIPQGMAGHTHLSLSDEFPYAQAFATISAH